MSVQIYKSGSGCGAVLTLSIVALQAFDRCRTDTVTELNKVTVDVTVSFSRVKEGQALMVPNRDVLSCVLKVGRVLGSWGGEGSTGSSERMGEGDVGVRRGWSE